MRHLKVRHPPIINIIKIAICEYNNIIIGKIAYLIDLEEIEYLIDTHPYLPYPGPCTWFLARTNMSAFGPVKSYNRGLPPLALTQGESDTLLSQPS